eukprot:gene12483-15693_t
MRVGIKPRVAAPALHAPLPAGWRNSSVKRAYPAICRALKDRGNLVDPSLLEIGRIMGEGSFGEVFEGSIALPTGDKEKVVMKRVKDKVEGAEEMGRTELLLNAYASKAAKGHCADFVGFSEVTAAQANHKLTEGVWLMWRYEGSKTLGYYMRRRDCVQVLAEDLGVEEQDVIPTVMTHMFECLQAFHAAGLVHRDVKPLNLIFAEKERRFKLIDLGACADLRSGTNYVPGESILDLNYCPPEQYVLPTDGPDLSQTGSLRGVLSPMLWAMHKPDRFDSWSAGIVLLQLAIPSMRSAGGLRAFNAAYGQKFFFNLRAWKKAAPFNKKEFELLDANGGAGWDLLQGLLRERDIESNSFNLSSLQREKLSMEYRLSATEALNHRFMKVAAAAPSTSNRKRNGVDRFTQAVGVWRGMASRLFDIESKIGSATSNTQKQSTKVQKLKQEPLKFEPCFLSGGCLNDQHGVCWGRRSVASGAAGNKEAWRVLVAAGNEEARRVLVAAGNEEARRVLVAAGNEEARRVLVAAGNEEARRVLVKEERRLSKMEVNLGSLQADFSNTASAAFNVIKDMGFGQNKGSSEEKQADQQAVARKKEASRQRQDTWKAAAEAAMDPVMRTVSTNLRRLEYMARNQQQATEVQSRSVKILQAEVATGKAELTELQKAEAVLAKMEGRLEVLSEEKQRVKGDTYKISPKRLQQSGITDKAALAQDSKAKFSAAQVAMDMANNMRNDVGNMLQEVASMEEAKDDSDDDEDEGSDEASWQEVGSMEEAKKLQRANDVAFNQMLAEQPEVFVNSTSTYDCMDTACHDDPRFLVVPDRRRKLLWKAHIKLLTYELTQAKANAQALLYALLRRTVNADSLWDEVSASLANEPVFNTPVLDLSERLAIFNDLKSELRQVDGNREESEMKLKLLEAEARALTQKKEEDAQRRQDLNDYSDQQFFLLLTEAGPAISPSTSWALLKTQIWQVPRHLAVPAVSPLAPSPHPHQSEPQPRPCIPYAEADPAISPLTSWALLKPQIWQVPRYLAVPAVNPLAPSPHPHQSEPQPRPCIPYAEADPAISPSTSWALLKTQIWRDPRYLAVPEVRRQNIFKDFLADVTAAEEARLAVVASEARKAAAMAKAEQTLASDVAAAKAAAGFIAGLTAFPPPPSSPGVFVEEDGEDWEEDDAPESEVLAGVMQEFESLVSNLQETSTSFPGCLVIQEDDGGVTVRFDTPTLTEEKNSNLSKR